MFTILLLAALPEEYRYLKKVSGHWRLVCYRPFRKLQCSFADKELILVETGMGEERIVRAIDWATAEGFPSMILSIGFCGSLTEDLPVGSVVLCETFQFGSRPEEHVEKEVFGYKDRSSVTSDICRALGAECAQLVTLVRPEPKHRLSPLFVGNRTVIDMESYFVARFASENTIPFLCLRAVSDGLHDEIEFDVDEISVDGRVEIFRVLGLLLRNPKFLPAFFRAWIRSNRAARRLAKALFVLLALPVSKIAQFALDADPHKG